MTMKVVRNCPSNQIVFFVFNFFLMLIGGSYLGIGIWLVEAFKIEKSKLDLIKEYYTSMGAIMITAGALCVFLCLVGYILSCWRRLFLLISYLFVLIIILLFGVSIGIVGFVYAANVSSRVTTDLKESVFRSLDPGSVNLADSIQQNFKCCGFNDLNDYSLWANRGVPVSCCKSALECDVSTYYGTGCLAKVRDNVFNDMLMSGAISLAIALPTLLGIVMVGSLIIEEIERADPIKYRSSRA